MLKARITRPDGTIIDVEAPSAADLQAILQALAPAPVFSIGSLAAGQPLGSFGGQTFKNNGG